jgi:hypothetical protein
MIPLLPTQTVIFISYPLDDLPLFLDAIWCHIKSPSNTKVYQNGIAKFPYPVFVVLDIHYCLPAPSHRHLVQDKSASPKTSFFGSKIWRIYVVEHV